MQIRQTHCEAHPRQLGSLLKLLDSRAFNPISRRRDHTHLARLLYHLIPSIRYFRGNKVVSGAQRICFCAGRS
jgi:hypothetical protein